MLFRSRKYDHLAREFANLLIEVDKEVGPTYYARNFGSAITLVQDAHNHIQHQKCRELAREIEDFGPTLFDDHPAFEAPSYYGYGRRDDDSIRGQTLDTVYKAMSHVDSYYYWEALGASEYFMNLDRQRFVMTITDHIEYGKDRKSTRLNSSH